MTGVCVGVDGSSGSLAALHWAADEARRRGTPLNVVVAWQYPVSVSGTLPSSIDMEAEARLMLTRSLSEAGLESDDRLTIGEIVVCSAAAPALIDASTDADLLVVGSRGHGAFAGMLLGSVSLHCATHARCPVVVVPSP